MLERTFPDDDRGFANANEGSGIIIRYDRPPLFLFIGVSQYRETLL